jgi:DNA repair exonuclease SbcCD nuclease subunit
MKLALICDTHWGTRNDNKAFYTHKKKFLDNIFFPIIEKEGVENIIHLGDLVDRRKYINFKTLDRMKTDFIEPIRSHGIKLFLTLGNHDTYFKNTSSLNSVSQLFGDTGDYFKIIDNPWEYEFDGLRVLFLPWINNENREKSFEAIKNSKATVAMGHLGISGFEMASGFQYNGSHGVHPDLSISSFGHFDLVFSGHFHTPSSHGSISYLGAPFEYTWADSGSQRGFHLFDTETRQLTFIKNPYHMFFTIFYEGQEVDVSKLGGAYVKLVVKDREDEHHLNQVIEAIENVGVTDLQVIDGSFYIEDQSEEELFQEGEDTLTILNKYVDQLSTNKVPKKDLSEFVVELYGEALQVE